jgi:hypothetical protein
MTPFFDHVLMLSSSHRLPHQARWEGEAISIIPVCEGCVPAMLASNRRTHSRRATHRRAPRMLTTMARRISILFIVFLLLASQYPSVTWGHKIFIPISPNFAGGTSDVFSSTTRNASCWKACIPPKAASRDLAGKTRGQS